MHPVLVKIGTIEIRYYGLMYVIGIVVGLILLRKEVERKRLPITRDDIYSYVFWVVIGGIFFARIYYVIFMWKNYYSHYPSEIFAIWHGGLAIHGGIIGGVLTTWLWTKVKKVKFLDLTDATAPMLALGQAFGRFGNFMNGDAHGLPTKLPWGIVFPKGTPAGDQFPGQPLHPVMLYELGLNLISFFILWKLRKKNHKSGFILAMYLLNYGIIRFFVSFFRADSLMVGHFRGAQIISAVFVVGALFFILRYRLWIKENLKKRKVK
ncbi:MAG: prolipoprotein diacylglyceryl transferase [Spirochaetes bacterium]|nr:MAG: prolipoprotein diacylglyceryl transferase [Spirochaetota bacterium]